MANPVESASACDAFAITKSDTTNDAGQTLWQAAFQPVIESLAA